jgi:ABC-type nitrate/sulfonate/bicarbonate transport system permease component
MILSPSEIKRRQRNKRIISLASVIILLVLWYLVTAHFKLIPPLEFPS